MWLAYFIVLYPLIISAIFFGHGKTHNSTKKIYLLVVSLPLIILSSLRTARGGCDTAIYLSIFNEICDGDNPVFFEFGFTLLLKIISIFTHDGHIMLFIINVITFLLFGRFILKYSSCVWLSFFLFIGMEIFDQSMNLIRQILALSIIVNSFDFLVQKKYFKFLSIVLFASLFHSTAILFIFAILLNQLKLSRSIIIIYIISIPILVVLSSTIIYTIMTKLHIYEKYLTSDAFGIVEEPKTACILHLLISMSIFFFCYYFGKHIKKSKNDELMTKLLIMGALFWAASVNFSTIGRAALYYDVFSIIIVPNILFKLKLKTNILIISSAFLVLFIIKYFVIAYMRPGWFAIYPYEFYFNH